MLGTTNPHGETLGMSFKVKMTDLLIEGITNPEPKPGLVDSVKEYILTSNTDTDVEEKRESLAILASLGTAKDYLGVQMTPGNVNKLTPKGVEKYYYRYQSVLGRQVINGLVENVVKLTSKVISHVVSIDDPDALSDDLLRDVLVKRELLTAAGNLVLNGGLIVALASALFHVASHVDFIMNEEVLVEQPPEDGAEAS